MPGMIGEGGAHHHLDIGIDLRNLLDGLKAVQSWRHAHIDEGQRVRSLGSHGLLHHMEAGFSLFSETQFEGFAVGYERRLVE